VKPAGSAVLRSVLLPTENSAFCALAPRGLISPEPSLQGRLGQLQTGDVPADRLGFELHAGRELPESRQVHAGRGRSQSAQCRSNPLDARSVAQSLVGRRSAQALVQRRTENPNQGYPANRSGGRRSRGRGDDQYSLWPITGPSLNRHRALGARQAELRDRRTLPRRWRQLVAPLRPDLTTEGQ